MTADRPFEFIHHPARPGTGGRPPVLFVHGAWHGAWCWEPHFMPYFADHGRDAFALSLTGHGETGGRVRWTSGGRYVADVREAIARVERETGRAPALVGHSMGGYVLMRHLETATPPAAVLLAPIPLHGSAPFTARFAARAPLSLLKAVFTQDMAYIVADRDAARTTFFSPAMPREQADMWHAHMGAESTVLLYETLGLRLARGGRVRASGTPLLLLAAASDRVFSGWETARTARALGAEYAVMPGGHDLMLEPAWQETADRVLAWLDQQRA